MTSGNYVETRALGCIYVRIAQEQHEGKLQSQQESLLEPLRMLIQGLPGAGKSQVIAWIRKLFEEVLGWRHGREFVCLASMNTMAALIGGFTIHAWGDVPVNDQSGRNQAKVCHGTVDIKRIGFQTSALLHSSTSPSRSMSLFQIWMSCILMCRSWPCCILSWRMF